MRMCNTKYLNIVQEQEREKARQKRINRAKKELETILAEEYLEIKKNEKLGIRTAKERTTWTYFVLAKGTGLVKIGQSSCVESRISDMMTGNPLELILLFKIEGPLNLESNMHRHFKKDRVKREWFKLTDEMIEFLEHAENKGLSWIQEKITKNLN